MNVNDFNAIIENRIAWCRKTLCDKGDEYARDDDRLWNFKVAGRKNNVSPAEALMGMKVKHDVSIDDIVDGLAMGIIPPKELVAEKIGDSINYLYLLEGLIEEARQEHEDFEKDYSCVGDHELDAASYFCPEKLEKSKALEPISIGQEVYILKDQSKVHIIPDKSSRSWNEPKIIPNCSE